MTVARRTCKESAPERPRLDHSPARRHERATRGWDAAHPSARHPVRLSGSKEPVTGCWTGTIGCGVIRRDGSPRRGGQRGRTPRAPRAPSIRRGSSSRSRLGRSSSRVARALLGPPGASALGSPGVEYPTAVQRDCDRLAISPHTLMVETGRSAGAGTFEGPWAWSPRPALVRAGRWSSRLADGRGLGAPRADVCRCIRMGGSEVRPAAWSRCCT